MRCVCCDYTKDGVSLYNTENKPVRSIRLFRGDYYCDVCLSYIFSDVVDDYNDLQEIIDAIKTG